MMSAPEWLRLAWAQTWQLTLLIVVIAAVVRVSSRHRPHLAHALWLVVLIKGVTPPLWSSPSGVFCWLETGVVATRQAESELRPAEALFQVVAGDAGGLKEALPNLTVQLVDGDERAGRTGATRVACSAESGPAGWGREAWLLLVWLTGTGLALAVAGVRWWRCWVPLRRQRVLHDAAYDAALAGLASRLRLRRPVRLLVTASRFGPAVLGLWRPVIVLPESIVQGKSPADLEPILAHELIHVRRGDLWVGLLQTLAVGLWWFHPLVWLVNRWISREAERCCDEAVLATLRCAPARYARCLLEVLERKQMLRPVPAFPGVRPVEVTSQRLERIMQLGQGCRQHAPWWCWIVTFAVAAAALPGAAWVAAEDEPADLPRPWQPQAVVPQPLPPARTRSEPAVRPPLGPLVTRQYDLADVLAKTREELGGRQNDARSVIADELAAAGGAEWARLGIDVDAVPGEDGGVQPQDNPLDRQQPELKWRGTAAIVRHDEQGQQRIAERIAQIRRYGFAQLQIDLQFITARSDVVDQAVASWRLSPGEIPADEELGAATAGPDPSDLWAASREQRPDNRLTSSIEQRCPFQFQVVDRETFRRIEAALKADRNTSILCQPTVVTCNGRTAMVHSGGERPFVVGLRGEEPQIQLVQEGVSLRVTPELLPATPAEPQEREVASLAHVRQVPQARLNLEFVHAQVLDVATRTVQVTGRADPVTLQVPRVQRSAVESTVLAPLDQTLLIGGLQTHDGKAGTQTLLLALTVRRVAPELLRPVSGVGVNSDAGLSGEIAVADERVAPTGGAAPQPDAPAAEETCIFPCVYHVADLVVPLPGPAVIRWGEDDRERREPPPGATDAPKPDFDALIKLIRSSIAPQSWDSVGGPGSIEGWPTNLSLIVSQTTEVHGQIAELLQDLRRLHEVQVTLETRVVGLADADLREIGVADAGELAGPGHRLLSDAEMGKLIRSVQDREQNGIFFAPKVTVFNGQSVTFQLGTPASPYTLELRTQAAEDRQSVQLRYAASGAETAEIPDDQPPLTIAVGETVLIDTHGQVRPESFGGGNEEGVPMFGGRLPYLNKLFKNAPERKVRQLAVLVTPRTIAVARGEQ